MQVALIGPSAPHRGGISRYNDTLAQQLRQRGHGVLQIAFRRLYPARLFPGRTQQDPSLQSQGALPLLDSLNPLSWGPAVNQTTRFGAQVAVLHWWHPFFFALTSALLRRLERYAVPTLVICHNVLPHEAVPAQRWMVRVALRHSGVAMVHSQELLQQLAALLPRLPARRCLHPLIREGMVSAPAQGIPEILFFGYVRPYKGLGILLDAFALLRRHLKARLRIAGEFYEDVQPYLDRIRQLNITDDVVLENQFVPEHEIGSYFQRAAVVVLPYLRATQSGVVALAYSYGVPVITTQTGGLPEMVLNGETGTLVPPGDAVALAQALLRFFQAGMGPRLRDNIRHFAQRMNWDCPIACIAELACGNEAKD